MKTLNAPTAKELLLARIQVAIDTEKHDYAQGKKRTVNALRQALSKIRWTLKVVNTDMNPYYLSNKVSIIVDPQPADMLTNDITQAMVYDGRDNEDMKLAFWSQCLGEPLEIVLL